MSLKHKCCECGCEGENCGEYKEVGCTHPCCYCLGIEDLTDCDDPEYCNALSACWAEVSVDYPNDIPDPCNFTIGVSIEVPEKRPNIITFSNPDGTGVTEIDLSTNTYHQIIDHGLGTPPGVGWDPTTCCDNIQCSCDGPQGCNCGDWGCMNPYRSGLRVLNSHFEYDTSEVWPGGGTVNMTATKVGNCAWYAQAQHPSTGQRLFLRCPSAYNHCADMYDPDGENTNMCDCRYAAACCDPTDPKYSRCADSCVCDTLTCCEGQGPGEYLFCECVGDSCCDCNTNNPDGCDPPGSQGGEPPVWVQHCACNYPGLGPTCDWPPGPLICPNYLVYSIPVIYTFKYSLYLTTYPTCHRGAEKWNQVLTVDIAYDWDSVFGGTPIPYGADGPYDGIWAWSAYGVSGPHKSVGSECGGCSLNCSDCDDDCAEEDCSWMYRDMHENAATVCGYGTWTAPCKECPNIHRGGPSSAHETTTSIFPEGFVCGICETCEPDSETIKHDLSGDDCDFYFNAHLYTGEEARDGGTISPIPCNKRCPQVGALNTVWSNRGYTVTITP